MRELREYIDKITEDEIKSVKTSQEQGEAYQIIAHITEREENEFEYLRQEDVLNKLRRSPIDVPGEYWEDAEMGYKTVLTSKGEVWARREIVKLWQAKVEFWAKLVLPVVALVISIIALVKKSH